MSVNGLSFCNLPDIIPVMAKKSRASDRHLKKTTSFRLEKEHRVLLAWLEKIQRRSRTTIVEMALEQFAEKCGLWPLPPDKQDMPSSD